MPKCFTEVKAVIKPTDTIRRGWGEGEGGDFRAIKEKKATKITNTFNSLRKLIRWKDGQRSQPAIGTGVMRAPT